MIGLTRSKPAPQKPEPGRGRARRTARSVGSLRDKKTRRRLYLRLAGLALVFFVGYLGITFVQVWSTSRQDGARQADAAVVLGAAQYDGRPSAVLEDRLEHALDLYERGLVKVIVVTGGKQEGDRFTEAFTGYTWLREHDVPESALLTEVQGHNSWESIAAAARILRDRGLTDAVMVTDGYHALRVDAIADELGLDSSVSPSRRGGSMKELVKETGAVAIGRIVGFRRLVNVDDQIDSRIVSQE